MVGPYLSREERERFDADYSLFNVGLMKLPFDLPGFAFRKARLAVDRLVETLAGCAGKSKERMERGEEPCCLIDFWMQEMAREVGAAREAGEAAPPPPHSGDREIGGHLFDFLFAAQDASTSSLLWAVALLDSHPQVLAKVSSFHLFPWCFSSNSKSLTLERGKRTVSVEKRREKKTLPVFGRVLRNFITIIREALRIIYLI